jgi:hypothetical protein
MDSLTPDTANYITNYAASNGVNPALALSIAQNESGGNQYANDGSVLTSPAGAKGMFQLLPSTAADYQENPDDPMGNIRGGIKHLAAISERYKTNDPSTMATVYHAGFGNYESGSIGPKSRAYAANVVSGIPGNGSTANDVDPSFVVPAPNGPTPSQPQSGTPTEVDPSFVDPNAPSPNTPAPFAMGDGSVMNTKTGGAYPQGETDAFNLMRNEIDRNATPGSPQLPLGLMSPDQESWVKPGQSYMLPSPDGKGATLLKMGDDGKGVVQRDFASSFMTGAAKPVENEIRLANQLTGGNIPFLAGADNHVNAMNAQLQNQQQYGINAPNKVGNFLGEVAGTAGATAPLTAATAPLSGLAALGGAALNGAVGGALLTDKRDPFGVLSDAGFGLAGGAVLHGGIRAAGNFFAPQLSQAAQTLNDGGVYMTPGATMGGVAKSFEDKMTSMPVAFTGDSIGAGQKASVQSFNLGTGNQVLAPIGQRVSPGVEAGHDLVTDVGNKISNVYNHVLPNVSLTADPQLAQDMTGVANRYMPTLPPQQQNQLASILSNNILSKATGNTMSGDDFKLMDGNLGRLAAQFGKDPDVNNRLLGSALQDTQMTLRDGLARQNPAYAPDLNAANQSWAMFSRLRDAASRLGSSDGVFTPGALKAAARAGDNSVGHGSFARGDALLQKWAEAGQQVIPNKIPDSGSAGRALMNLSGFIGTGMGLDHVAPEAVVPALVGGAAMGAGVGGAYATPIGRNLTTWALAQPKIPALGDMLRTIPTGMFGSAFPALRDQRDGKPPS